LAAEWPRLIPDAIHWDRGVGAFSIRVYPKGQERYLLLDDFVLAVKGGTQSPSMHGLNNPGADVMVRFLEKAFVKVQGSYASLDGYYKYNSLYRHPARALQLMTGSRLAMELDCSSQGKEDDFERLYAILCSTQGTCVRVAHCRKTWKGLRCNHGYSLFWVGHITYESDQHSLPQTIRLVCLRNPHGKGSFTGKYGRGSPEWTISLKTTFLQTHSEYFQRCPTTGNLTWRHANNEVHATDDDDGIFFMEFSDFLPSFPCITIVGPIDGHGGVQKEEIPDCIYKVSSSNLYPTVAQCLFGKRRRSKAGV